MGLLAASCTTSADRPLGGFEFTDPKATTGLVLADPPSATADLDQLDRHLRDLESPSAHPPPSEPGVSAALPSPAGATEPPGAPVSAAPPGAARLVDLPKLNRTELAELVSGARLRLHVDHGYRDASGLAALTLPAPPEGVTGLAQLEREDGPRLQVMRLGYHPFLTRPAQFWVEGLQRTGDAAWEANPDVERVVGILQDLVTAAAEGKKEITRDDLEFRIIQISYIDVEGALEALKGFGIETLDSVGKVTLPVAFSRLPLVGRMPSPDGQKTALLGADSQKATAFDLSMSPSMATSLPPDPNMARSSQVLVYFHPAHPEQFSRVQKLLREVIDRPDRQIFIEGLILEISEEGLKELGVDWEYQDGGLEVTAGSLFPGLGAPLGNFGLSYDSLKNLDDQWVVRLRALIENEKAEVLSRPSVLTLNNRQATIRVGQEIPIATSQESSVIKDVNRVAFSFKYLPTGISLNIRPRITEEGNEVSMLVDTVVSAAIPGADLELRSNSGEVLASAPTVATRRVQTYTRIGNNTPFIIGGLVNRETTSVHRKVPLLGDIPYLGNLFRSKSTRNRKQEVIIVLTPHVLPEEIAERAWGRYLPRDDDKFDDVGNNLFRASYRIREEDVFDLSFLDRNESLRRYRDTVRRLVDQDFRLAEEAPFRQFLDGRTPGEHILVERMIYEVIKRLSEKSPAWLDRRIAFDRLIFFSDQNAGGYDVQFLESVLGKFGDGISAGSFFTNHVGKALAVVFTQGPDAIESGSLTRNPIPELLLMDCPDRRTWGDLLWEWNQPDAQGQPRSTILIHQPEDLVRLQRAILLREIINLNGGPSRVNRKTFSLGQVVLVPDENPHETRLLDSRAADLFFHTEHYYAATLRHIREAIAEVDRRLAEPAAPPRR